MEGMIHDHDNTRQDTRRHRVGRGGGATAGRWGRPPGGRPSIGSAAGGPAWTDGATCAAGPRVARRRRFTTGRGAAAATPDAPPGDCGRFASLRLGLADLWESGRMPVRRRRSFSSKRIGKGLLSDLPLPARCLHCGKTPPASALGVCAVCWSSRGVRQLFGRRRGWSVPWELHLRGMANRAGSQTPLFTAEGVAP